MNARRLLRAAGSFSLSWVISTTAGSALAQATPPPLRPAAPEKPTAAEKPTALEKAVAVDPSIPPPFIASGDPKETGVERARRQVVALLRGGKPFAVGTVLAGDGRILTALSPLGHGNNVDARFSDGKVTRVRVVHSDRAWDLALVAPAAQRSDVGLRASRAPVTPGETKLTAFSAGAKDMAPVAVRVKAERDLIGGDNARLERALELESKHKANELGSVVVDERGDVVAVLTQACAPVADKPCSLVPYAAPVSAIKGFLQTASVAGAPPRPPPPFGIRGMAHDAGAVKGVRVLAVTPRSPAAAVVRSGADTIVAVDGTPVTTPEALTEALRARAGGSVQLLVFGQGRYREVRLPLRDPDRRGLRFRDPWKRPPVRGPRQRRIEPGY